MRRKMTVSLVVLVFILVLAAAAYAFMDLPRLERPGQTDTTPPFPHSDDWSWVTWSEGDYGIVWQGESSPIPKHIMVEDPGGVYEMIVTGGRVYYLSMRQNEKKEWRETLIGVDRSTWIAYPLIAAPSGELSGLAVNPSDTTATFISRGVMMLMDVTDLTAPGEPIKIDGSTGHSAGDPSFRDDGNVVYSWVKESGYKNKVNWVRRIIRGADVTNPANPVITTVQDDPKADLCSPSMVDRRLAFVNNTEGWIYLVTGRLKQKIALGYFPTIDPVSRGHRIIYAVTVGNLTTVNEAVVTGRRVVTRQLSGPGPAYYPGLVQP